MTYFFWFLINFDRRKKIITTTTDAMMVEKASISIIDEEKGFYKLYESIGITKEEMVFSNHKEDPFFKWIKGHKEIFIREELERYTTDAEALAVADDRGRAGRFAVSAVTE